VRPEALRPVDVAEAAPPQGDQVLRGEPAAAHVVGQDGGLIAVE